MKREDLIRSFLHMPTLTTARLEIRPMKWSDADDMFAYAHRPDVTRYLLWRPHPNLDYTRQYLAYITTRYRTGDYYDWALTLRENGQMIGTCGFTRIEPAHDLGEIGYVLNPDYWGQGLATEAVREILRFGFETLRLHRIEARYMVGNDASRRVMEKCGMTFEGIHRDMMLVKGQYRDIGICACVAPPV